MRQRRQRHEPNRHSFTNYAPTIIIVGEDDPACTVAQSKVLEEHIKGSQLVV